MAKTTTVPTNAQIVNILTKETRKYINIASREYDRSFKMPVISLKLRGGIAGIANYTNWLIKYNPALYLRYTEDFMTRTVPHEVAHLICDSIYKQVEGPVLITGRITTFRRRRSIKPHGPEWKAVMRRLGVPVSQITRCHSYDTEGIKNKRAKPYEYDCDCENPKRVTITIHRRILRGASYTCRSCKMSFGEEQYVGSHV